MNFSEELQKMYRNILLQQHNIAYASMIAAFSSAATSTPTTIGTPSTIGINPVFPISPVSLDNDIPREEIECDAEIILVKNLIESLKHLSTNLNGLHGKKFGFREVIEMANARPAYSASPDTAVIKRNRLSMETSLGSPSSSIDIGSTPLTPSSDAKGNSVKKTCSGLKNNYDSDDSSHDGRLEIIIKETSDNDNTHDKNIDTIKKETVPDIKDDTEYKPSNLRIERMRNIQRKKPKFNVSNLDLVYHSNMARNFPGSEYRSQEQQLRRDKNTLAARISRTKNKAYEKMLEKESVEVTSENITMKRKIACLRVYADSLMKLNGLPATNFTEMWEANIKDIVGASE